jgi:hypothetical protein
MPQDAGQTEEGSDEPDPPASSSSFDAPDRTEGGGRSWIVAGVVAVLVVVVVGVVLVLRDSPSSTTTPEVSTTPTSVVPATCGAGSWPKLYQGQPANLAAATDTGFYVWFDPTGWHIRTLVTTGTQDFIITITGSAQIDDLKQFKQVPAGAGTLTRSGNTVTLKVTGGDSPNGLDFSPCGAGLSQFRVDLASGDLPWPVQQIWVGPSSKAVSNPMTIERS